jgi:hypothetical protein
MTADPDELNAALSHDQEHATPDTTTGTRAGIGGSGVKHRRHPALSGDYDTVPALILVLPAGQAARGIAQATGQVRGRLAARALACQQHAVVSAAADGELGQGRWMRPSSRYSAYGGSTSASSSRDCGGYGLARRRIIQAMAGTLHALAAPSLMPAARLDVSRWSPLPLSRPRAARPRSGGNHEAELCHLEHRDGQHGRWQWCQAPPPDGGAGRAGAVVRGAAIWQFSSVSRPG